MSAMPVDTDPPNLEGLLRRIGGSDRQAFEEFYRHTSSVVYGTVVRVLRDPGYSEETVQEIYLQVWGSADRFDPARGSALAWLSTLARRRAIDRVRAEQSAADRVTAAGGREPREAGDPVVEEVTRRDETRAVIDCLDELTALQRSTIEMAYYGGLTYREVSEATAVALPTVKSRIRDGLIRLKRCLGTGGDD